MESIVKEVIDEAPKRETGGLKIATNERRSELLAESFAHLPVKETVEIVAEPERADPELYEKIGEERTFEVDVVPPQLFKREIVRPKFRHRPDRNRSSRQRRGAWSRAASSRWA